VLAGLAVVLVAGGAFVAWPRPDRVTQENFDRISEGMSRAEVEAILGPAGDYRTGPTTNPAKASPYGGFYSGTWIRWDKMSDAEKQEYAARVTRSWQSDQMTILVGFDSKGVADMQRTNMRKDHQSFLDNLLWRAKRQWRNWFPG
jgi:hypothetical protein